jgi:hypothetical protein
MLEALVPGIVVVRREGAGGSALDLAAHPLRIVATLRD